MNDVERIKTALTDLLNTLGFEESISKNVRNEIQLIRKNLWQPIEPTQPEGYQGLNKWYWCNDVVFYVLKQNGKDLFGYGYVKHENKWNYEDTHMHHLLKDDNIRPATESEIKEAILKGCEQHGIAEGARVKCLYNEEILTVPTIIEIDYQASINNAWIALKKENDLINVFDNGKFAEVVKEEKEKYRLGRKQQRAILETQTGKEYLLFPQGHEDTARCFLRYLNGGDLSKNELIKIIGSLNKPSVNMIDCDEAKKLKELLKECLELFAKIDEENILPPFLNISIDEISTKLKNTLL